MVLARRRHAGAEHSARNRMAIDPLHKVRSSPTDTGQLSSLTIIVKTCPLIFIVAPAVLLIRPENLVHLLTLAPPCPSSASGVLDMSASRREAGTLI